MRIGIFGLGYIGFSTIAWFSCAGIECVGIDIDENKVDLVNHGTIPIPDISPVLPPQKWDPEIVTATTDWEKVLNDDEIEAIFIAIPTERNGKPWWGPLRNVIEKMVDANYDKLTIIESTMAVGMTDKIVLPFIRNVAVCPRRDWFTQPSKNLKTLPRIVGGVTPEITAKATSILSIVCDQLFPATHYEAELVKAYENTYRHLSCILAQEMALAYPSIDIKHVLELGGTKWNVESMFPNVMGTGGYCLPLAPKYIVAGAEKPDELELVKDAIQRDDNVASIFNFINNGEYGVGEIGCLGLSYMENIKVHVLSPLIRLMEHVPSWKFMVHDPLYNGNEIMKITGCPSFDFPGELDKFKALFLLSGHDAYKNVDEKLLVKKTRRYKFIFDNTGIWEHIDFRCPYYTPGRPGWMDFLRL